MIYGAFKATMVGLELKALSGIGMGYLSKKQ